MLVGVFLIQNRLDAVKSLVVRDGEQILTGGQQSHAVKIRQAVDQTVCRENHQSVVFHIHQHHHHIIGIVARLGKTLLAAPVAEIQRCLIAVVPICNVQLPIAEILLNRTDHRFVVHDPQAVNDLAVVELITGGIAGEQVDPAERRVLLIHIKRIDLAEIAEGGLHQAEAIFLGLAQRLLVRQNNPFAEFFQLHAADQALDLFLLPVSGEFLLVDVQSGLGVLLEDSVLHPALQRAPRFAVGIFALRQLQADHVAGIFREIGLPLLLTDDIVGRTGQRARLSGLRRIPQAAEGLNFSHDSYLQIQSLFHFKRRKRKGQRPRQKNSPASQGSRGTNQERRSSSNWKAA